MSTKKVQENYSKVSDFVEEKVLKLQQNTLLEHAVLLMGQNKCDCALVVDEEDRLQGVFDHRDLADAVGRKVARTKKIKDLLRSDGCTLKSELSVENAIDVLGKHKQVIAPVVDDGMITGLVRLQDLVSGLVKDQQILRNKVVELSTQLDYKDDYLGVVSHDVRTPLSVIALCCDYLGSENSLKSLNPNQKSFIDRIQRNAESAANMVSDILDVVRLEKGFKLHYEKTNVDDFLGDSISNLQVIANEKKLEVVVSCEDHIEISMDRRRVMHVLENLVNNAVKFSPTGKKIYVTASCELRDDVNYLVLAVQDEGLGIKGSDSSRIFQEFTQLETGEAKALGVGLGLSIAKKFVSLHQGFMEVEGGWQKGATFRAYIPGAIKEVNAETLRDPNVTRVLLVEDDESIREYFEEELTYSGYEVVSAVDGEDGIHAYFRTKPDLIVSDIRMPKVDGLEFLAKVRMTDKSIPFILCSGYYPGLSQDLAASGQKPDKILEKPLTVDSLIESLESLLDKQKTAV